MSTHCHLHVARRKLSHLQWLTIVECGDSLAEITLKGCQSVGRGFQPRGVVRVVGLATLLFTLWTAPAAAQNDDHAGHHGHHQPAPSGYARTVRTYDPPDVTLVDSKGAETPLAAALAHDGPLLLQFIFTTCPAVCPVLAGTFGKARDRLPDGTRLISISIDPEHDTPARLADYARRFGAGPGWHFLTGRAGDVAAVQKTFDAFSSNKMQHRPLTFLRPAAAAPWIRLDGFLSAAELVAEVERARQ